MTIILSKYIDIVPYNNIGILVKSLKITDFTF